MPSISAYSVLLVANSLYIAAYEFGLSDLLLFIRVDVII